MEFESSHIHSKKEYVDMVKSYQVHKIRLRLTSVVGVITVALASFILPPIVAQHANAVSATNGRSELISIGAGKTIKRSFSATKGNLIIYGVGNNSTKSSVYFNILNSSGKRVDGCMSFCSEIPRSAGQYTFLPPANGTYVLTLYLASRSVAGTVRASLLDVIKNHPQTLSGTAATNVLSTDVAKVYQFAGTKGSLVIYGVGNGSTESSLYFNIYNSSGKRVDGCMSFCSEISRSAGQYSFLPPAKGTYFLALYLATSSTVGNVSLSLLDVIKNRPQTLTGTTAANVLTSDVAKVYQFAGIKGNLVIYGVGNNSQESFLRFDIYNSSGKRVDGCMSFCSEIPNSSDQLTFVPPATGTYYLALHFSPPFTAGKVGLSILDVISNPPQTISGTTTVSVLNTDVVRVYQFLGTQVNQFNYEMTNNSAESFLRFDLYDSSGKRVDGCMSFCSQIPHSQSKYTFAPPATGAYFLALYFAPPSTGGTVDIALP